MHSAALLASMLSAATAAARLTVEASKAVPDATSSATCAQGASSTLRTCRATNLEPVPERRSATRSCEGA